MRVSQTYYLICQEYKPIISIGFVNLRLKNEQANELENTQNPLGFNTTVYLSSFKQSHKVLNARLIDEIL